MKMDSASELILKEEKHYFNPIMFDLDRLKKYISYEYQEES